jgi:ABC-type multidrug transport system fused ATPase/permease subunit
MKSKSSITIFSNIEKIIVNLKVLLGIFPKKLLPRFYIIQLIILVGILLEFVSIFSIIPFLESFKDTSDGKISQYLNLENLNSQYLFLAFIFFIFLSNMFQIFINIKTIKFSFDVTKEIKYFLYKLILLKKYNYFLKKEISFFNSLFLQEAWRVNNGIINPGLMLFSQLLLILFVLTGLLFYSFFSTLIVLSLVGIFYLFYLRIISNKIYNNSKKISLFKVKLIQQINDNFSTIKEIIFKKNKTAFSDNFLLNLSNQFDVMIYNQFTATIVKNLFEIFICIFLLFFIFFYKNINFASFVLDYGVFIFAGYKLIPSFHKIYASLLTFLDTSNALNIIAKELKVSSLELYNFENIKKNQVNEIDLQKNFFSYDKKINVLKNIDFKVAKGDKIGICGKSGSGKTTFADILSGLLIPNKGSIKVNNYILNIPEILLRSFAYCGQKNFLIEGTVRDNITLKYEITQEEIIVLKKLLKIVEIDEFVNNLSNGIDTLISAENGIQLSSGQAQRICIARCLFSNKNFLIFDESFNNLDLVNRDKILSNILKSFSDKSIIIISHDINLFQKLDKIVLFRSGEIVATGNYKDLSKNNEYFKQLLVYQNEENT